MSRYQVQQRLMFSRDCLRLSSLSVIVLSHVVTSNCALFSFLSRCVFAYHFFTLYIIPLPLFFTNSSFVNHSFYIALQFVAFSAIFLAAFAVWFVIVRLSLSITSRYSSRKMHGGRDYSPLRFKLTCVAAQIKMDIAKTHPTCIEIFRRYFPCDDTCSIVTNFLRYIINAYTLTCYYYHYRSIVYGDTRPSRISFFVIVIHNFRDT